MLGGRFPTSFILTHSEKKSHENFSYFIPGICFDSDGIFRDEERGGLADCYL